MGLFPVIMCGGSGTRLWPLSRPERPKQFVPLIGPWSTFQQTVLRLGKIKGANPPLIIAGLQHAEWLDAQLNAIGCEAEILLEPAARDSAPAVAAAAAWIQARDADGVAIIVAADHHIPDDEAFADAVEKAELAAGQGWIVTLGVQPTEPSIAYGYIDPGEGLPGDPVVKRAAAFVEKPNASTADRYLRAGYLWNSGNFIATADTLISELRSYAPAVMAAAEKGVASAERAGRAWRIGAAFVAAPKISLDYAVMEHTEHVAVLPVSFAWSDLGAWQAVWRASEPDINGNIGSGAWFKDAENCLVLAPEGRQVAAIGVRNLAIIADEKGVLVCDLSQSQSVKGAAEYFQAQAAPASPPDLPELARRYDLWLRTSALPLWWSVGADHLRGGYYDLVGLDGRPIDSPRRARVQARHSFVYATAARLGFAGPWREAADHGLNYLNSHYRRADGLYRTSVAVGGASVDDSAYLYDQAFILLAGATLFGLSPDRADLRTDALQHLSDIRSVLTHGAGGFRETGDHPFQANAHMHLLEAALAWREVAGDPVWTDLARSIVDLALDHFIDADGGFLREFFDADWQPAPGEDGRLVEPGHQFEWAWLLERWSIASGSDRAHDAAVTLFEHGRKGVDEIRGVAMDELSDDFSVRSARARCWPQTEYIKAALLLAESASPTEAHEYRACAAQGASSLWRYLDTPAPGQWRDKLDADGRFEIEPSPASSFYHIFGAVLALAPYVQAAEI